MSASLAMPAPVVVDILELGELGARHDKLPVPPPPKTPWAPGDMPHGEDLDLNEYPVELLRLRKCRSFKADLLHKLTIIIRAHGGYGRNGLCRAARVLQVSRVSLWSWLKWRTAPAGRVTMERIDNRYADALEKLVAEKVKRSNKRRKHVKKPNGF